MPVVRGRTACGVATIFSLVVVIFGVVVIVLLVGLARAGRAAHSSDRAVASPDQVAGYVISSRRRDSGHGHMGGSGDGGIDGGGGKGLGGEGGGGERAVQ